MKFSAIACLGALSIARTHAFSPSIKFQTKSFETATRSLSIGPLSAAEEEKTDEAAALEAKLSEPSKTSKIEPPKPFIPAMDPMYSVRGEVGKGNFLLSRGGGPTIEELSNENLIKIVLIECSDLEVSMTVHELLNTMIYLHDVCVAICRRFLLLKNYFYLRPFSTMSLGQHSCLEMSWVPFQWRKRNVDK